MLSGWVWYSHSGSCSGKREAGGSESEGRHADWRRDERLQDTEPPVSEAEAGP